MEKLQLRLILGGLAIILLGFLYGMVYTINVDHAPRMSLKDDYKAAFTELADRGLDAGDAGSTFQRIDTVSARSIGYQRAIGAHTHAIYLGMLVIILGLYFNTFLAGSRHAGWLAAALGGGILIYPLGLATQAAGLVLAGEALALIGSLMIIACVATLVLYLFKKSDS